MLILAVDTSTRTGSLAVVSDGNVFNLSPIPQDAPSSSSLFTQLKLILAETGYSMPQFDVFTVCAGPGSFTGLRVGLTAVKAWAEVYQRPIAAVSGLQAIAAKGLQSVCQSTQNVTRLVAAFFSAGRGQVYGSAYTHGKDQLCSVGDEMVLAPRDFLNFLGTQGTHSDVTLFSTTPSALDEVRRESVFAGTKVQAVSESLAGSIGLLGYKQALRDELVDAYALDANYVRRCDAELSWADRPNKVTGG
ncbi:MAG TPA: tRNA (adenosine(37)-N6)-threonylcarbamoyltransferase complex dimerization subunit type 1 TsaB [Candidatus Dormibacteraeota bacterium]|nr:tRNA (adenosine(37)-N6)-threonylcarbamoyltransferase complex dimerization subunit type 1 TsaB [Candidatus Dormibacteraeota bacterium]